MGQEGYKGIRGGILTVVIQVLYFTPNPIEILNAFVRPLYFYHVFQVDASDAAV